MFALFFTYFLDAWEKCQAISNHSNQPNSINFSRFFSYYLCCRFFFSILNFHHLIDDNDSTEAYIVGIVGIFFPNLCWMIILKSKMNDYYRIPAANKWQKFDVNVKVLVNWVLVQSVDGFEISRNKYLKQTNGSEFNKSMVSLSWQQNFNENKFVQHIEFTFSLQCFWHIKYVMEITKYDFRFYRKNILRKYIFKRNHSKIA